MYHPTLPLRYINLISSADPFFLYQTVSTPTADGNSFSSYSGYAFLAAGLCCGLRSVSKSKLNHCCQSSYHSYVAVRVAMFIFQPCLGSEMRSPNTAPSQAENSPKIGAQRGPTMKQSRTPVHGTCHLICKPQTNFPLHLTLL